MLRTSLLALLLTLKLFSCSGEFSICQDKARDSKAFVSIYPLSIAVEKNDRLIYTPFRPSYKVKKYDPFLGLALIDDTSRFKYPFIFYSKSNNNLVSIDAKNLQSGALLKQQCGLDALGTFSSTIIKPSLIMDNCCGLAGVGTSRGVIDHHYLKHFLEFNSSELVYGDVGIRFESRKNALHVSQIDPFFVDQQFQLNDKIIAYDGKKVNSLCDLRRKILFAKIASIHSFIIERKNRRLHVKIQVQKRLGGGLLGDTFLERFGLALNNKLCISSLTSKMLQMELEVGDCLIQVNFHDVKSAKDIQKRVQKSDIDNALLFQRNDFQFFIHINGKDGKITKKND
ncbi:MAG: PDZ domain-containing protein [Campylobacterota bacterium]|nr:PDZ domain-containing protein [Campylobacterota bacterium]